jgi:hypothetical protein
MTAPTPPVTAEPLLEDLRQRRLTLFAGAGISVLPPSSLPSWWQVNEAIVDALAGEAAAAMPSTALLVERVKRCEAEGKLPPEFAAEVVFDTFGDDYFEVLRCLEGARPNRVHRWFAALVKASRLPVILTTNFDTLIERACDELGAPLKVLVEAKDYAGLDLARHLADPAAPTLLAKLHGTAPRPKRAFAASLSPLLAIIVARMLHTLALRPRSPSWSASVSASRSSASASAKFARSMWISACCASPSPSAESLLRRRWMASASWK